MIKNALKMACIAISKGDGLSYKDRQGAHEECLKALATLEIIADAVTEYQVASCMGSSDIAHEKAENLVKLVRSAVFGEVESSI